MAQVTLLACDRCGRSGAEVTVESYVVETAGRRAEVDLCNDDAGPLIALLDEFPKRRRRKRTVDVIDVEDIPRRDGVSKRH